MRQLECEFDAMPELAAVVVDMNEEVEPMNCHTQLVRPEGTVYT